MSKHRDIDFFNHPTAAREWQAQEAALQAAREGREPTDAREAAYRHIDETIRADDAIGLPADFAEQLAAKAGPVPTAVTRPGNRLRETAHPRAAGCAGDRRPRLRLLEGGSWFMPIRPRGRWPATRGCWRCWRVWERRRGRSCCGDAGLMPARMLASPLRSIQPLHRSRCPTREHGS